MNKSQPGVLAPVPPQARYLTFSLRAGKQPRRALKNLAVLCDGESCVVGIGQPLLRALDAKIPGMRRFPAHKNARAQVPSTPAALWFWLRGTDRGELLHRGRAIERALAPAFRPAGAIEAYRYGTGLDLTGYEDGTENPKGQKAVAAALVRGMGAGLDGSSFVAVQQWVHDLDRFAAMSRKRQDDTFGRRKRDNVEMDGAPASAHVKRTAQESFTPGAFVVRRSMPWHDATRAGLVFVAFGHTPRAFEMLLTRMTGNDDGIVDALFKFTQPVTGAYFWCPPVARGRLDFRKIL